MRDDLYFEEVNSFVSEVSPIVDSIFVKSHKNSIFALCGSSPYSSLYKFQQGKKAVIVSNLKKAGFSCNGIWTFETADHLLYCLFSYYSGTRCTIKKNGKDYPIFEEVDMDALGLLKHDSTVFFYFVEGHNILVQITPTSIQISEICEVSAKYQVPNWRFAGDVIIDACAFQSNDSIYVLAYTKDSELLTVKITKKEKQYTFTLLQRQKVSRTVTKLYAIDGQSTVVIGSFDGFISFCKLLNDNIVPIENKIFSMNDDEYIPNSFCHENFNGKIILYVGCMNGTVLEFNVDEFKVTKIYSIAEYPIKFAKCRKSPFSVLCISNILKSISRDVLTNISHTNTILIEDTIREAAVLSIERNKYTVICVNERNAIQIISFELTTDEFLDKQHIFRFSSQINAKKLIHLKNYNCLLVATDDLLEIGSVLFLYDLEYERITYIDFPENASTIISMKELDVYDEELDTETRSRLYIKKPETYAMISYKCEDSNPEKRNKMGIYRVDTKENPDKALQCYGPLYYLNLISTESRYPKKVRCMEMLSANYILVSTGSWLFVLKLISNPHGVSFMSKGEKKFRNRINTIQVLPEADNKIVVGCNREGVLMFTYNYVKEMLVPVAMDVCVRNASRAYHITDDTFLAINNSGEMKLVESFKGFTQSNYMCLATVDMVNLRETASKIIVALREPEKLKIYVCGLKGSIFEICYFREKSKQTAILKKLEKFLLGVWINNTDDTSQEIEESQTTLLNLDVLLRFNNMDYYEQNVLLERFNKQNYLFEKVSIDAIIDYISGLNCLLL